MDNEQLLIELKKAIKQDRDLYMLQELDRMIKLNKTLMIACSLLGCIALLGLIETVIETGWL